MIASKVRPMVSGYCYESARNTDDDESWDIGIHTPSGTEVYLRTIRIDGSPCDVFRCSDGIYRAQLVNRC